MPIFFMIVGVLLIIVGVNDKMRELGALVKEDFSPSGGQASFASWLVAIFVIGSLGYIKSMKPVANAFLVLVVTVMILANNRRGTGGGFFDNFTNALKVK